MTDVERLAETLTAEPHYYSRREAREIAAALLPVVDAIARERTAAELEESAVKLDVSEWAKRWLRNRAATLRNT